MAADSITQGAMNLFGFGVNPRAIYIVIPSIRVNRRASLRCVNYPLFRHAVSPDDVLSALRMHALLTGLYGDVVEVAYHTELHGLPSAHRVLVGGPPTNTFIAEALRDSPIRFGPSDLDRSIQSPKQDYRIELLAVGKSRYIVRDFCLLSRRVIDEKVEVVVAGLRAYGQAASYRFLSQSRFYEELRGLFKKNSWQVLLEITVRERSIVGWRIMEWYAQ